MKHSNVNIVSVKCTHMFLNWMHLWVGSWFPAQPLVWTKHTHTHSTANSVHSFQWHGTTPLDPFVEPVVKQLLSLRHRDWGGEPVGNQATPSVVLCISIISSLCSVLFRNVVHCCVWCWLYVECSNHEPMEASWVIMYLKYSQYIHAHR